MDKKKTGLALLACALIAVGIYTLSVKTKSYAKYDEDTVATESAQPQSSYDKQGDKDDYYRGAPYPSNYITPTNYLPKNLRFRGGARSTSDEGLENQDFDADTAPAA